MPSFLEDQDLRLLLFGGKGGVGKTTCATATALFLARNFPQRSLLLISTDPAHSLFDSLAGSLFPSNLNILEFDAQESLVAFKKEHLQKLREIASRGTFLADDDISQFIDLSLPGLDELMALLQISSWVKNHSFDCIIVDTAPTGHTLRLLTMPELIRKWLGALDALLAKHRYMKKLFSDSDRRDELDRFLEDLSGSVKQMETLLQDPTRCRFVPVMLAEELSICETISLIDQLQVLQVPVMDIVVNRLYPPSTCPVCRAGRIRQRSHLRQVLNHSIIAKRQLWVIPLYPLEVCGFENLLTFWGGVSKFEGISPEPLENLIESVPRVEAAAEYPPSEVSLLIFAGKGGVGKTTLACATALRLARDLPGKEIFLFSSDPAHSLSDCLEVPVGPKPKRVASGITALEIDARAEFETFKKLYANELNRFLNSLSSHLDITFDRQVMERIMDLSPPGLDEVMALTQVMTFLKKGDYDIFVLDSSPTGHLVRLLELPEIMDQWLKVFFALFLKYKHIFQLPKISHLLVQMSKDLKFFRTLLKDPGRSALFAVTNLTEMCFEETKDLVAVCGRMGINAMLLFHNLATPASDCPLCSALHQRESEVKDKFRQTFPAQSQSLIYRQGEPRGLERLGEFGEALYRPLQKKSLFNVH